MWSLRFCFAIILKKSSKYFGLVFFYTRASNKYTLESIQYMLRSKCSICFNSYVQHSTIILIVCQINSYGIGVTLGTLSFVS